MRHSNLITAIATGVFIVGGIQAQAQMTPRLGAEDPARQAAFTELKTSMVQFAKTDILPQVRIWKSELDKAMSPEDLQTLNTLRAKARELKIQGAAIMKKVIDAHKSGDQEAFTNNRPQMQALFEGRKAIMTELKPLAIKYSTTLQAIGALAKPTINDWKTKGKQIFMDWSAKYKGQLGENGPGMCGGMEHLGALHMMGGGMGKRAMIARFMLFSGGDDVLDEAPLMHDQDAELK